MTAVVPYLAYARKDQQTKERDPVTTRYVAQLFEAGNTDRVMTLDVHNIAAFQNAFRCRTIHLSARQLSAEVIARKAAGGPVAIFSPGRGGVKRAQLLKEVYERLSRDTARLGFMALLYNAGGGIYLWGPLLRKMESLLRDGAFRLAFGAKGRRSGWLSQIPVLLIRSEDAVLRGAAKAVIQEMR